MIPGTYIRGMLVIAGDLESAFVAVRDLGSATGEEIIRVIPNPLCRLEPPPLPVDQITEPETPPRKKSWKQQQRELPKFLR